MHFMVFRVESLFFKEGFWCFRSLRTFFSQVAKFLSCVGFIHMADALTTLGACGALLTALCSPNKEN